MIDYFQSISQNQLPDALHKKTPKGIIPSVVENVKRINRNNVKP